MLRTLFDLKVYFVHAATITNALFNLSILVTAISMQLALKLKTPRQKELCLICFILLEFSIINTNIE